jgi:hypothetical protein
VAGRVTVLTPKLSSGAIELGRKLWRKQILPIGSLNYEGRKLNFTRDYLGQLAQSFNARAFDTVPFQLADDQNRHTNDPERTRGEILGVELATDGLYGTFSVTDKGDKILREFPNLGVSVRIVEDMERGTDGAQFPVALQHVLATWDPRVNAMRPWEAVTCANETSDVIDLSALVFTPDGSAVVPPPAPAGSTQEAGHMPEAPTKEELAQVIALAPLLQKIAASLGAKDDDAGATGDASTSTDDEGTDDDEGELTDAELAELAAAANDAATDDDAEGDDQSIAASNKVSALELANVDLAQRMDALTAQNARLQTERDQQAFKAESDELVRLHGVPPAIVALARPLLEGAGHTIELSRDGGKKVDAGQVMRKVLKDWGLLYKGMGAAAGVDLSGNVGSPLDLAGNTEKSERDDFVARAKAARFAE